MYRVKVFGLGVILFCFVVGLAGQTEDWLWAKQAGGANSDYGKAIAVDASGNSYVVGEFSGTVSFGGTILTSNNGSDDIFVAKLDTSGNWIWAKQAGGPSYEQGNAIAVDPNGNSYVTGSFYNTASFGGTILTSNNGSDDIFVAKLDTNGNWLWAKKAGGSGYDYGYDITTDASGNSFVTGSFSYTSIFGGTILTNDNGAEDIFVAKLDTNGNWIWANQAGGEIYDKGNAIAIDAGGNCYVTGYYYNYSTFGNTTLTSDGTYNCEIFVAKLDSSGNWTWAKKAGGTDYDRGRGIAVDASGNVYVMGVFSYTASFGSISLSTNNWSNFFVAKMDTNGTWIWAKKPSGNCYAYGDGIVVDAIGNSYVTGYFYDTASFGDTSLTSNGEVDIFVAKIDSNGNWTWANKAGGAGNDYSYGIAIDTSGSIYMTGVYIGPASFGSTVFYNYAAIDIFVGKLGSSYQVIAPNGGEYWQNGSLQSVYWNFIGAGSYVDIYLSQNNGQDWITLNSSPVETALGEFSFTVPDVSSSQCLIKVQSSINSAYFDVSDAQFTIGYNPPALLFLTAPTNARLQTSKSYAINWLAIGVSSVNLDYSTDGGSNWQNIATGLPANPGTYNWTVPNTSASVCYLRISDAASPSIYDLSDDNFSICQLVLFSPNGGEYYQTATYKYITWHAEEIANVKLEYSSNAGITWQTIIASTGTYTSSFGWSIPSALSDQYLIKISDLMDNSISDQSDNVFTVHSLALTYPNNYGIKMQAGGEYNITWSEQSLPGTVSLELSTNGTDYTTIATGIAATAHTYLWTVPDIPSSTCRIRIVSDLDSQVFSTSASDFTIGRLYVLAPNGMEIWSAQSVKTISWSCVNVNDLKLEYTSNDGASWQVITASVAASGGSYNWTLPSISSTQCRVRLTDTDASSILDTSDAVFTIRPQVTVVAPNGNESLSVASVYRILWSCTADVSYVLIDYSIDGGTNWLPIQASNYPASVGRYDWTVPNNASSNCLVRVRRPNNSGIFDVSDAFFTIAANPVPPVAQFSADITSGLEPLTVQFSDESTSGTGNITSWLWDFGNGDSSSLQHPLFVFDTPGVYSVTLTVSNSAGLNNSFAREDYITVLPRYPEIATYPVVRLDFGNVYLGSASLPMPLWIINTGTATMLVDTISYFLSESSFVVQERQLPFSIPEGDSLCVHLVFTPQVSGSVTDSLYIHSNDPNSPNYALALRGSGEYVPPKPPTGVQTTMIGYDMHISWDAVTETIFDTPITPDVYIVLYNETPYEDDQYYYYLTFTTDLEAIHNGVARFRDQMFYRVVAVKFYRDMEQDFLNALSSSGERLTWGEIKDRLTSTRNQ